MDELISRQDAIDAMNEVYCHIEMIKKRPVNKTEQAMYLDMIGAVKSVPSAQPEQRWIPVTEQLPKPNEYERRKVRKYYLVQNVYGDMMVASYRRNTTGKTWWEQMYANNPVDDEVVAWMPLPEPYRGEI